MKLFRLRGGIHPDYRKELASEQAIERLPMPTVLYIPLQQHVGAPAEVLVAAGDRVRKGQMIACGAGNITASQHAPTSGTIRAVADIAAPHPSGLAQATIILDPDGRDEWDDLPAPIADPFALDTRAISERVAWAGIVGMGGAAFPAAVKLTLGTRYQVETLLLNGAECEPYLTCDDRVMREHADEVIDGGRIMAHALGARGIIAAIEENKPQAIEAMRRAAAPFPHIQVVAVPTQYPMGSAQHLTLAVTGRETPAGKRNADVGVVVHNVATARAVHQAVRHGRPLITRVVTVTGEALHAHKNVEAPIGSRVADLVTFCGGFSSEPAALVNGGPMMGQPLPTLDAPVVKGMAGLLALTAAEIRSRAASPCIRCGACVEACPSGLVPLEMAALIRRERIEDAARLGVDDCIGCGSCAWTCPAHIPLLHYFNYAKGRLESSERERRNNERTRTLAEAHNARMEKVAAAKRAAAAARKRPAPAATDGDQGASA